MLRISLLFLFAALPMAMAQTGGPEMGSDSLPSETTVMAGRATLRSGAVFAYRSVLRPANQSPTGFGAGGMFTEPLENTIHRYMIDRNSGSYFGYDIVIGMADTTGAYLVTFEPLSHIEKIDDAANLKLSVLPQYPAPQVMHDGEIIELDLMVSPDGKKRLTDIISIRLHEPPPAAAKTTAAPRDFTIDDGAITFDATRYTFWKQGQKYSGPTGFTGKPGGTFWIAIPGQGRYILSLTAHEGFAKSGTVRDNVVAFEDAGQRYELRLQSPIAGAGKAWNLYVMHDLTYAPGQGPPGMVSFGTDRLENLIARHQ